MFKPEITPPTELPVTLAQIKAQSIVDFADDDVLLDGYLQAATSYLDGPAGVLGRAVMAQGVIQRINALTHCIRIPYGHVTAVSDVSYYDETGVVQTITGWSLLTDEVGSFLHFPSTTVFPEVFDRPDAAFVSYTAGYSSAASVPESIKLAIAILATTWYSVREDMTVGANYNNVPFGVHALIAPHRRVGL